MKDLLFVSDFDGTLTKKDFYHIVIEKYLMDEGNKLFDKWKRREIKDVEFLGTVFQSINRDENEILEDILSIELDPYASQFIKNIKNSGGDFLILSAGTSYYIERLLDHHNIRDVEIISNKGVYENRGIKMIPDNSSPFYSDIYGVDKELVVKKYKTQYRKICYAGDSQPDFKAAISADMIFARGSLVDLLRDANYEFTTFNSFRDIEKCLIERGVL